jgi:hypothetical protein
MTQVTLTATEWASLDPWLASADGYPRPPTETGGDPRPPVRSDVTGDLVPWGSSTRLTDRDETGKVDITKARVASLETKHADKLGKDLLKQLKDATKDEPDPPLVANKLSTGVVFQ